MEESIRTIGQRLKGLREVLNIPAEEIADLCGISLEHYLKMEDGTVFKPNDRYPLTKEVFRLYYTSASIDQQTIDVYVEDNFGQMVKLSFEFNSQKDEEKEKKDEDRK